MEMLRFERTDGRWYKASIETDLLGRVYVSRINGGQVRRAGSRQKPIYCPDRDRAISELAKITRARLRNGYRLRVLDSLD